MSNSIITLSPEQSLLDWKRRRIILQQNNIPVSKWHYCGKGIIIEDFYPKEAKTNLLFRNILEIAFKLGCIAFNTLKFLDDIRVDDNNSPFYVDFGFDPGDPTHKKEYFPKKYLIKEFPNKKDEINTFYSSNE